MSDGEDEYRDSELEEDECNGETEPETEDRGAMKTPDLDYDMWEGQFEFVGPSQGVIPQGLLKTPSVYTHRTKSHLVDVNHKVNI